jgi:hypothetical protein
MLPPSAETGTGVTVDVGVVVGVSVDHAQKLGPAQPTKDALGVWQMGLFALPLLMTGEKVGDIGIGSGVGQWAPQEVNGSGTWGGGGGDCRPTRRMPAARPPPNDVPTVVPRRRRRAVRLAKGAGGVDVRADMMTTRIEAGLAGRSVRRNGRWRGRVNGRLETNGVTWGNVPLTRRFSPTAKLRRLPFGASVGHQGQRCRALLMGPVDRVGIGVESEAHRWRPRPAATVAPRVCPHFSGSS